MSQFDADQQFEQLKDMSAEMFTLPSELPEPVELPEQQPFPPQGGGLPDFFAAQKEAQEAERMNGGDHAALREASRELPDRIVEALRNG